MTSRAMTTRSPRSARPVALAHSRQISHLALPPLLIAAPQPQPQQQQASPLHTSSTRARSRSSTPPPPTPPRASTSTSASASSSSSILRPPTTRPAQGGSLIAYLQQQQASRAYTTSTTFDNDNDKMASDEQVPEIITRTRAAASGTPGEQVEPRQTLPSEDMEPNPANSIPLPPNRQKLVDDVIALYSCQPTIERVARYAPGQSFPTNHSVVRRSLIGCSVCLR